MCSAFHPVLVVKRPSVVALSCACVGIGSGGTTPMAAYVLIKWLFVLHPMASRKVTVVNYNGASLMNWYILPTGAVTDYRTAATGITSADLNSGAETCMYLMLCSWSSLPDSAQAFGVVRQAVAGLICGKILVGHQLWNALMVWLPIFCGAFTTVTGVGDFASGGFHERCRALPTLQKCIANA